MSSAVGIGWRPKFAESDVSILYELIKQNPLGILTTSIPENSSAETPTPVMQSTFIPFILDAPSTTKAESEFESGSSPTLGVLRGHIARKNPHTESLIHSLSLHNEDSATPSNLTLPSEAMILFPGPVNTYITPSYYTSTKPLTGKVVPTWNFSAAQIYGRLTLHHDSNSPATTAFLQSQLTNLTRHGEEYLMGFSEKEAWKVSDAPDAFISLLSKAIVGIEIEILRIEGKFKVGQETKIGDREGTIRGLKALGTKDGDEMARMMEAWMQKEGTERENKGLVAGKKVRGKWGWYYTSVEMAQQEVIGWDVLFGWAVVGLIIMSFALLGRL